MELKRYRPDDPALQGREVVLASDLEQLQASLTSAIALATALDGNARLDERLEAAGMLTVAQILAGAPLDAFIRHAGVRDLASFGQWLEMRRAESVRLQARFALEKRDDDELYEWVIAHAAAFSEVAINFRAASNAGDQLSHALSLEPATTSDTIQ
ncbi:hypothetical protein ACRCPT_06985 [Pseudomonas aeruginosa]|jgi:hypothetical protein|uniref:hypothetical protein n=1 Tax=Ectopseudomonas guguanensis TaxID=1198456 RepID=UPI0021F0EB68|nr:MULTISPECIES: hypothetical protein [Pseudomonas]MCV4061260.1 hypothetical protein [Pseudomonas aeruginosa]MCV4077255.1 hypothetical protein [Pseudomonas aeruginosa]MCV4148674.1 hypothetical protein [Pseudomonas aeruginosa]MCV4180523.1 hypothetical protein [Pseudomonas aeruginosa]MCV4219986.1 hypothetical protein [Pseudomonas aeruginosa]